MSRLAFASAVVAVFEHVVARWIQCPESTFTWTTFVTWYFDEAVVEGEVVADGVLPALLVLLVVRKAFHDELVDTIQRDLLIASTLDGHCDQSDVRVGRLLHGADGSQIAGNEIDGSDGIRCGGIRPKQLTDDVTVRMNQRPSHRRRGRRHPVEVDEIRSSSVHSVDPPVVAGSLKTYTNTHTCTPEMTDIDKEVTQESVG